MSISELAPPSPPLSPPTPPRRRIAASLPLPELPRYFHPARSYQPRSICTCGMPREETFFQPFIICKARAPKCPTRYYHAHCVGEVPRHPLDITPWYCAYCMSDNVVPTRVCICGDDSQPLSEPIVQCSRKAACSIRWYHRTCAGSPEEEEEWVCKECEREDREDEEENEQKQKQKQQQAQKQKQQSKPCKQSQPIQQKQQKQPHQDEPENDEDSEPPPKRVRQTQQKRQKRHHQHQHQHQHEPEDDKDSDSPEKQIRETQQKRQKRQDQDETEDEEDAAPPAKRVRFSPDPLPKEPVIPARKRAEVSPERSERNAEEPGQQSLQESSSREQSPDEVEYCFCGGPSSMEMVACDGKKCEREWFHFECVGLTEETVPEGKWYCDECGVKETKKKGKSRQGGKKRKRRS